MVDILFTTTNAVLPIVLLILLGYLLRQVHFLDEGFVKIGNKLIFKLCLPCMLFVNIYDNMDSFASIQWDVALYSVIMIFMIFLLGLVTAIFTTKDNRRRGVLLQCAFRSNFSIIGLTLVERLGGNTVIAGVMSAFTIPMFNILAVIALSIFVRDADMASDPEKRQAPSSKAADFRRSTCKILKDIVTNPLIIGVFLGLLFVGIREMERIFFGDVPFRFNNQLKFLYTCAADLKAVASPFALLVLGGQFEFSAVKGMTKEIVVGTFWRVVLAPLLGIGAALLLSRYTSILNFGSDVYPTFIALFGSPVAVSSAIMAGAMNNDEQLGTQYVVWTSICSVITIFVTIFFLMTNGIMEV